MDRASDDADVSSIPPITERLGGLEVDVQLDFRCLLDRQFGRLPQRYSIVTFGPTT
ncbi:MAG TPA: hypothetical protein VNZ53_41620 [Steroidobacteraceae bacterium]|nr:hypothetical protein [Steroidobacteraceae bacterium]